MLAGIVVAVNTDAGVAAGDASAGLGALTVQVGACVAVATMTSAAGGVDDAPGVAAADGSPFNAARVDSGFVVTTGATVAATVAGLGETSTGGNGVPARTGEASGDATLSVTGVAFVGDVPVMVGAEPAMAAPPEGEAVEERSGARMAVFLGPPPAALPIKKPSSTLPTMARTTTMRRVLARFDPITLLDVRP